MECGLEVHTLDEIHADTLCFIQSLLAVPAPHVITSVREKHRVDVRSVEEALSKDCCAKNCTQVFKVSQVVGIREWFAHLSSNDQAQWVLNMLWEARGHPDEFKEDAGRPHFKIGKTPVCKRAFLAVYGIGSEAYTDRLRRWGFAEKNYARDNYIPLTTKTMEVGAWLRWAAANMADHQPDKPMVVFSFSTKKMLYHCMLEMNNKGHFLTEVPGYRLFTKVLRTSEFKYVRFFKRCRFTKCDQCAYMSAMKRRVGQNMKGLVQKLNHVHALHVVWQMFERRVYYDMRLKAIASPDEWMTMIMDGSDQDVSVLPSIRENMKKLESIKGRPSIKLVAVKCHGRQNFVFGVPPDQRHGSSMTCSIINKVLNARSPGDKARKLWIQLDNTSGENKNNFVMGYLGTLVLTGAFDEIHVGFLPVGHTHEDIDALHAVHSVKLNQTDFVTVEEMFEVIRKAHASSRVPMTVQMLWAYRDYMAWVDQTVTKIFRISDYRHFRLFMKDGLVQVTTKFSLAEDDWGPPASILKALPPGEPAWAPRFQRGSDKEVDETVKSLRKLTSQFRGLRNNGRHIEFIEESAIEEVIEFVESTYLQYDEAKKQPFKLHRGYRVPQGGHRVPQVEPRSGFNQLRPTNAEVAKAFEEVGLDGPPHERQAAKQSPAEVIAAYLDEQEKLDPAAGDFVLILKDLTDKDPYPVWVAKVLPPSAETQAGTARIWWYERSPSGHYSAMYVNVNSGGKKRIVKPSEEDLAMDAILVAAPLDKLLNGVESKPTTLKKHVLEWAAKRVEEKLRIPGGIKDTRTVGGRGQAALALEMTDDLDAIAEGAATDRA